MKTNKEVVVYNSEFAGFYRLARYMIVDKIRRQDGSLPRNDEDLVDEILAQTWKKYIKLRSNRPFLDSMLTLRVAVKFATLAYFGKERLVKTSAHGWVDALNHVETELPSQLPDNKHGRGNWERIEKIKSLFKFTLDKNIVDAAARGISQARMVDLFGVTEYRISQRIAHIRAKLA